jgi:hypothetical protein
MSIISPTGFLDVDNDSLLCKRTVRSRETIDPKTDLVFYFNNYLVPKYGLDNINVNNCASFMKDLEMNWSKLTPDLKEKVLDILLEILIGSKEASFLESLIKRLEPFMKKEPVKQPFTPIITQPVMQEQKNRNESINNKQKNEKNMFLRLFIAAIVLVFVIFLIDNLLKNKNKCYYSN